MTSGIFDTVTAFERNQRMLMVLKQNMGEIPGHKRVSGKFNACQKNVHAEIREWTESSPEMYSWIRNLFRRLFGREQSIHKPAAIAHNFTQITDSERNSLARKANFLKTVRTVTLVAGALFLGVGVLSPLSLGTIFIHCVPGVAFTVISVSTALGIAGVALLFMYTMMDFYDRPERELRAKTDKDFQRFMVDYVRGKSKFQFSEEDVTDKKIHEIYKRWCKETRGIFTKKNCALLAKEATSDKLDSFKKGYLKPVAALESSRPFFY